MTGASLALLVAWLYLKLGVAGLLLGLPPLYLIYYSYDVYVVRARERKTYGEELASFKQELADLGSAARRAAHARSRRSPPRSSAPGASRPTCCRRQAPDVDGLEIDTPHRVPRRDGRRLLRLRRATTTAAWASSAAT